MTAYWRLDDACQTLVLAAHADRCPCVVYWGAPLPADEDLSDLTAAGQEPSSKCH